MLTYKEMVQQLSEAQDLRTQVHKLLDKVEDDAELELVKDALMKKYLKQKMALFDKFSWYEGGAATLVDNLIYTSKVDVTSKFAFVEALLNDDQKFTGEVFTSSNTRNLYNLAPAKIRNNPMFKEIVPHIMKFSEQAASGVGKGELFLLMFGKDSKKPSSRGAGAKGDVQIDGWNIEVKDSGGMIHAGKEDGLAAASAVFDFNTRLLKDAKKEKFATTWEQDGKAVKADPAQFRLVPGTQKSTRGGDWFWRYLTNDIPGGTNDLNPTYAKEFVIDYMQMVYYKMNKRDATRIGAAVYKSLGDKVKMHAVMEKYLTPWVFNSYKTAEGFDSLVVMNKNKTMIANIVDGDNIPPGVTFKLPTISKGKSTYAVPSGSMGIQYK
jgi:hypothetical protein